MSYTDNFYDEEYYLGHYDRERTNEVYYNRIAAFWKYNIFETNGVSVNGKTLDYGSGLGQVSAALHADCYDFSGFARKFLQSKGRKVFESPDLIPKAGYDYLLSSHCLEHVRNPFDELLHLKSFIKTGGFLVLILPTENMPGRPVFSVDSNKHFYCWNFQTITNLLLETGFKIAIQKTIYGPFGLSKMNNLPLVRQLGIIKKNFPSILTIAQKL
jgi:hypothetical protein